MGFRAYYEKSEMEPAIPEMIDTATKISVLVDELSALRGTHVAIYVDLEGNNLCRNGTVSLVTLMVEPKPWSKPIAYLVDVTTLGKEAFSVEGQDGLTLKDILETPTIRKVFFDVRNDSDALYAHFNIKLQGIEDVQLMELASRGPLGSKFLHKLTKCIMGVAQLTHEDKLAWERKKEIGNGLFKNDKKDAYSIFDERPLPENMMAYSVGDVQYLPGVRKAYWNELSSYWKQCVLFESQKRVLDSHRDWYKPSGNDKARSPWFDHYDWCAMDLLEWYEQFFDAQRKHGYICMIPLIYRYGDSDGTDESGLSDGSGGDWLPMSEDGSPIWL